MSDRLVRLEAMYEKDSTDAFCAYGIAMEHLKMGRPQEAVTWFDKAIQNDPDHAYSYYHKVRALSELGEIAKVRQTLARGLESAQRTGDGHAAEELRALAETVDE